MCLSSGKSYFSETKMEKESSGTSTDLLGLLMVPEVTESCKTRPCAETRALVWQGCETATLAPLPHVLLSHTVDGARYVWSLPALQTPPESPFSPWGIHRSLREGTRVFMPGGSLTVQCWSQRGRPCHTFPKMLSVSLLLPLEDFL